MFPILQLGPVAIRLPGLILLVGIWLGLMLIDREAPRRALPATSLNNMLVYGLIAAILGARVWYALRYINAYMQDPLSLLSLNPATLAPLEGALTGLLVAFVYAHRKRLPLWPTLDTLAPSLALFTFFLGLAHLSSGDAFGAPTEMPWSIELWGASRHPSQIYETLAAAAVFAVIWQFRARSAMHGFLFLSWMVLAAFTRLFLEAFRGDSVIILGNLRSAQVASFGVLLLALVSLHILARRHIRE